MTACESDTTSQSDTPCESDTTISQYSCKQCLDFLRRLQVDYGTVLHFDQTVGYETDIDMTLLLLVVMQRLGDHLADQVRMTQADLHEGVSSWREKPNGTL
jgi:hypothetical protein